MENTIIIAPLTTYRAEDGTELWDTRRIALESTLSRTAIRKLIEQDTAFPEPYAVDGQRRKYYPADAVREWVENSEELQETIANKWNGRGRPTTTHKEVFRATRV